MLARGRGGQIDVGVIYTEKEDVSKCEETDDAKEALNEIKVECCVPSKTAAPKPRRKGNVLVGDLGD